MVDLQQQLSLGGVVGEARRTGTVNALVWFADQLGTRAVFVRQTPFYTYSLTAQVEHRFCAVQRAILAVEAVVVLSNFCSVNILPGIEKSLRATRESAFPR
mgnify:CR=1 FL=1